VIGRDIFNSDNYGVKANPTTSHNPQANAITEQVHKVVNDMLRPIDSEKENLKEDHPFAYFHQSNALHNALL
jgi:hypothetical protein